jgi:hypothetical protein
MTIPTSALSARVESCRLSDGLIDAAFVPATRTAAIAAIIASDRMRVTKGQFIGFTMLISSQMKYGCPFATRLH